MMASCPWKGVVFPGSRILLRCVRFNLMSAASATTMPSASFVSSLWSRSWMVPRRSMKDKSFLRAFTISSRRVEEVAMMLFFGSEFSVSPGRRTRASDESTPFVRAMIVSSFGRGSGRSFAEWMAMRHLLVRSSSSISLVKKSVLSKDRRDVLRSRSP